MTRAVAGLRQAMRLARRELRGGLRGFGVFLTCLFLGVFAISGVGSFAESAKSGLLADAGALLGGDLEVQLVHRELDPQQQAFLAARGALSHVSTLRTMAATLDGAERTLVELKAVDDAYPLYGALVAEPPLTSPLGEGDALVDAALLERLALSVDDALRVGDALLTVRGVLAAEPDRAMRAFNLGPRLLVGHEALAATGLVQPGSLVSHAYRLRLPDRETVDALRAEIRAAYPEAGWRLRSWREAAPRVRFFLDRMNLNLTLIALCALLVGGLGVSGAVRGYLDGKREHIATMKCLGAPAGTIFTAYLLQILFLGALGASAGLACGAALPWIVATLTAGRMPIPLQPQLHPGVLLSAALYGLLIALAFSLKALGVAGRVPPAVLFRGYADGAGPGPGRKVLAAVALAALALAVFAVLTSTDRRLALWFILGAGACFALFRAAAAGVVRFARRLPRPTDPSLRLGLANIHRRGSPAASALFSLGLGLTALVTVTLVQANLDDRVRQSLPAEAPAYFFLDIQNNQAEAFAAAAQALPGVVRLDRHPTLRGRITRIGGVPVEEAVIDQEVRWAVRGDRYLSYAATQQEGAEIVAGRWWPEEYTGPPLISLTADLARGFGLGIGDTLTVNVLGREVTAEIANLREVDWSTLQLDFAILFAPGTLENAPQTHIAALHVTPEHAAAAWRTLTGRFPNVSAISTGEVLANVARTLERLGTAFRGMAALALLTGFLVLAGAVSADQHRRIHDAVIFKVCGATRRAILAAFAAEFAILGLTAGLLATFAGSLAAFGIVKGLMKSDFALHPGASAIAVALGVALTLLLGLLGTWKALGHKPAGYLRAE